MLFNRLLGNLSLNFRYLPLLTLLTFLIPPPQLQEASAQANSGGNAMTVHSDIQEANSETGVVTARGNVHIYYPSRQLQATSAQAQYFSRERRLILTGDVYVLQDGNSMRAETMTYLIDEGRFVAIPDNNRQVESTYLIKESPAPNQTQSAPQPQIQPVLPTSAPNLSSPNKKTN